MKASTLFVLTNHSVTNEQQADAKASLGVDSLVELPQELKAKWGTVPPEADSVSEYAEPFLEWLEKKCSQNDSVWVQGEWGVTVTVLDWCRVHGVRCVYATTKRKATEVHTESGVQMTHVFSHERFREYPKP